MPQPVRPTCVVVLLALSVLCIRPAVGQSEFQITQHYTHKDGLSNVAVNQLCLDSQGFLWVTTREGLNRFDGLRFKQFFHSRNDPNSLPHNTVNDILEYQPGFLLMATQNGLAVYNAHLGKFENDRIDFPKVTGAGSQVMSLNQDAAGRIWVNANGELEVFDQQLQHQFTLSDLPWATSIKGSLISNDEWHYDSHGRLWIPTDTSGMHIVDFKHKTVYNQHHNPDSLPFLAFKHIRSLLLDEKNNAVWIGPWGLGLYRFDLTTGARQHVTFDLTQGTEQACINALCRMANGQLLCGTIPGLFELDPVTLTFKKIECPEHVSRILPDNTFSAFNIVKAHEDEYWVGGLEGLFNFSAARQPHELTLDPIASSAECVDMVITADGMLYTLYSNGRLIETDRNRLHYKSYMVPRNRGAEYSTHMCEDHHQQLWIGSSKGMVLFNRRTKKFNQQTRLAASLQDDYINTLFCDRDGNLWIGTRNPFYLFRYHADTGILEKIENDVIADIRKVGEIGRISGIMQEKNGDLWMWSAVGGGILHHTHSTNTWVRYPKSELNYSLIGMKGVSSCYSDHSGQLWLSAITPDGLIRYDYRHDEMKQFSREDGIISDYILDVVGHGDKLWLTTETGYSRFNMKDHSVISFDFNDISYPFEVIHDSVRNELVIGTSSRLVFISTIEQPIIASPPVPRIDALYVNNQQWFIDPDSTKLRLKHFEKNITIDFTTPYFRDADKLKWAYYLEGADQDWQYPNGTRTAQYAALSSGAYVFKIRVADRNGNWGQPVTALSFTIVPPFWKTLWFLVTVAMLISGLTVWLVKRRLASVRYAAELKHRIAETEMMALRAQMNPHFIFNSLNSIDSLIQSNDKYLATVYLNKFARLIRNILDSSKQNTIALKKDVETLRLYIELEQFRNENKFTVDLQADPELMQDDYKVPSLIIQPYVENAILHGLKKRRDNNGHLQVLIRKENGNLKYLIEDNGVGRNHVNSNGNDKTSYGMMMSSERVKLFNEEEVPSVAISDLWKDGEPAGTRVEVILKMK